MKNRIIVFIVAFLLSVGLSSWLWGELVVGGVYYVVLAGFYDYFQPQVWMDPGNIVSVTEFNQDPGIYDPFQLKEGWSIHALNVLWVASIIAAAFSGFLASRGLAPQAT